MAVVDQLLFRHEALKGFEDEFFAIADVLEDFSLEDKISAIDAKFDIAYGFDLADETVGVCGNDVIREIRLGRNKRGDSVVMTGELNESWEGHIGEAVGVIGEECLLAGEVALHRLEALANIRMCSRFGEGDVPVVDVAVEQLEVFPAI